MNSLKQILTQVLKTYCLFVEDTIARVAMLLVIAVISSPVQHKSIPKWEMELWLLGAVCTTLLYAAQSLDYAAQWLTEWYSYNPNMLKVWESFL